MMWVVTKYLIRTLEMCMAWLTLKEHVSCALLEVATLSKLKNLFPKTFHTNSDSLFEFRVITINTEQCYKSDTLTDQKIQR